MPLLSKTQDIASSLLSAGKIFDANAFYSKLVEELSAEESEEKLCFDYGEEIGLDIKNECIRLGKEEFLPVFLDPRIATRWKQFCRFVEEGNFSLPQKARDAFFTSSPQKKYFRALVLTKNQYDEIRQIGFVCNVLRNSPEIFLQTFSLSLQSRLKTHAHEYVRTASSSYISFSAFPELAKYLTHRFFFQSHVQKTIESAKQEGYFLYLFPVTVSEFDFFSFGNAFTIDSKYSGTFLIHSTPEKNVVIPFEDAECWSEFFLPPEYIDFENVQKTPLGEVEEFKMLTL